ncbi:Toxin-antitoxin system, toxin component, HicA-like [Desulfonema limicola]|uniref:Toxin-antitoxin system, toxin component, HicA-like n=1 Tax=Desulfonema limicola TaxID=45656 RepID=A0A975GGA6_9BACT|nr:type II toxin-antitoxin system HicA family toxin [Desulfonema limicola]QTA80115.1 Toxin-antitoxin system, toxin component, HicA-like [Desulfonema limicola]
MTDMPAISFAELQKGVKKLGFRKVRQKGSHIRFVHQDGRRTTIPDHGSKDVPRGLLLKIIRYDLEMDISDFFQTLS